MGDPQAKLRVPLFRDLGRVYRDLQSRLRTIALFNQAKATPCRRPSAGCHSETLLDTFARIPAMIGIFVASVSWASTKIEHSKD